MKQLLISLTLLLPFTDQAQDDLTPIGYKFKKTPTVIKVYQDESGAPNLDRYNLWVYNYWFKKEGTTLKYNQGKYIKITIPARMKWSKKDSAYKNVHYDELEKWKQSGVPVDSDDFNSWLWVAEEDFNNYSTPYYGKVNRQFVVSGLTVPFRYRPKVQQNQSTALTGDVNLGTFAGIRLSSGNTTGISAGISLGLSSLPQNSANNSFIQDNTSQAISGINYGFALVLDWRRSFQVGLVCGFDHGVGNLSQTYHYQDKNWYALSLNYQFLDFGKSKGLEQASESKGKR